MPPDVCWTSEAGIQYVFLRRQTAPVTLALSLPLTIFIPAPLRKLVFVGASSAV